MDFVMLYSRPNFSGGIGGPPPNTTAHTHTSTDHSRTYLTLLHHRKQGTRRQWWPRRRGRCRWQFLLVDRVAHHEQRRWHHKYYSHARTPRCLSDVMLD
jgi:hypothetical protein